MTQTIVIIGAGFSGSLAALHLATDKGHPQPLVIYLIDPRGSFGPGLAYTTPSDRFKLNVRAKAMGAFPNDPQGFFRWLKEREPESSPEDFTPRNRYGEYLSELVERAVKSGGHHSLTPLTDEARDLSYDTATKTFTVELSSGREIRAEACVLAIGNLLRRDLAGGAKWSPFRAPYASESYEGLSSLAEILVVGSSLTAVDVILEAEGRGFKGRYTVISRNGRFPLPHEEMTAHAELPATWDECGSARTLVTTIRTEARRLGSSQPVFEAMRPKIQSMWRNLPPQERSRFLRHVRPFWEIHRHRIPAPHLEALKSLMTSGRLSLIAGRILTSEPSGTGVRVTVRRKGETVPLPAKNFDAAFMCIGPEGDLSKVESPLVQNLLRRGLLTPGPLKLGARSSAPTMPNEPPLFVVGPIQREDLWEITAVRELREEAQSAAARALSALR
jgi:uncharacterized NAD(P)/FAD-binding protein YdhS